ADAASGPPALGHHAHSRNRGRPDGLPQPCPSLPRRWSIGHRTPARGARPHTRPRAHSASRGAVAAEAAARPTRSLDRRGARPNRPERARLGRVADRSPRRPRTDAPYERPLARHADRPTAGDASTTESDLEPPD